MTLSFGRRRSYPRDMPCAVRRKQPPFNLVLLFDVSHLRDPSESEGRVEIKCIA